MDKATIRNFLETLVIKAPENRPASLNGPFFSVPLVGFTAATDDLFLRFQEIIGPFHLTPLQWLALIDDQPFHGGTVISWILPINPETCLSNREQTLLPSLSWALTRNDGEQFNNLVRDGLVGMLKNQGYAAIAPLRHPKWQVLDSPRTGPTSNWSERHAAYAAGLGTFSLNNGLITAAGIAHRCGSVITNLTLQADTRSYSGVYDYCLYYQDKSCGACIDRCPVGAISPKGNDKYRCRDYTYGTLQPHLKQTYGIAICGCGLCQTKVPCEARNPLSES